MISLLSLDYVSVQRYKSEIVKHFDLLSTDDIYNRFGRHMNVESVVQQVSQQLGDSRNRWYLAVSADLTNLMTESLVLGVLQMSVDTKHSDAEIGISVLPEARRNGIGKRLLKLAKMEAGIFGLKTLMVHMVSSNRAMRGLAQEVGIPVKFMGMGEAGGECQLEPATPSVTELWAYYTGQFLGRIDGYAKPYGASVGDIESLYKRFGLLS